MVAVKRDFQTKSALGFLLPERPGEPSAAEVSNATSLTRKGRAGVRLHGRAPALLPRWRVRWLVGSRWLRALGRRPWRDGGVLGRLAGPAAGPF